ncbi:MAG: DUF616 domain-containing protein [Chitinispirillaceae bacterium]|nr:DUF616 domain-containing protein [Chitinispirillaceae bacterium]
MVNKRIVVYTSIFGGYDGLLPQRKTGGVDYVCFSDGPLRASPWEVRIVPPRFSDPVRCAKEFKILPHRFFPDHRVSIWIDGNYLVVGDVAALADTALQNSNMAFFSHHAADGDARDCIYEEYESIMRMGRETGRFKDDPEIMQRQIERYRSEGYPPHNGLIFASVLLRRHHESDVKSAMERWWNEIVSGSRRDQLSFDYIAWKERLKCRIIAGNIRNNRWFFQIGIHRHDYRWKLVRHRIRTLFGIRHKRL